MKFLNPQKGTQGFSLVELLVVVAILAILAAIAIPLFLNQRSKAAQGATQSDARNLATNLNTFFANLPRSADPNVALNGSTAPNATLSGSGTIEVGGETLNVNLSPDATITKTGNANPADGAGLKITHAGVENWACVIPLPPSVAYAQTVTFQQMCGTVVSETGNLLSMNQAVVNADAGGFTSTNATLSRSTDQSSVGLGSLLATANSSSNVVVYVVANDPTQIANMVPVQAGETYTFQASVRAGNGTPELQFRQRYYDASGVAVLTTEPSRVAPSETWSVAQFTAQAPPGASFSRIDIAFWGSWNVGSTAYIDALSFHQGTSGLWVPPGVPIVE